MIVLPPAAIGVIGGGQLGMMIIREAQRMGYRTVVWDPDPTCPASRLSDVTLTAPFDDPGAARTLADTADVITYEFEHISVEVVEWLMERKPVRPGSSILRIAQHRLREKEELRRHGFPLAPFTPAYRDLDLRAAIDSIQLPVVIKTVSAGYDGKGQTVLRSSEEVGEFVATASSSPDGYIVEKFLPLQGELSVMVARGSDGSVVTFPVSENVHRENILHTSRVPARMSPAVLDAAEHLSRAIITSLDITGLLGVEMFLTQDETLLVNELAPRPHNSGHYTLDACDISQFEMLLRVVCDLPLPSPRLLSPVIMINILGKHLRHLDIARLTSIPGAKLHLYGKQRIEEKRKMGHVTLLGDSPEKCDHFIEEVASLLQATDSTVQS